MVVLQRLAIFSLAVSVGSGGLVQHHRDNTGGT